MSAPAILRANYSDLFTADALPALEELFRYELQQHPSRRDILFKQVSTDRDIWQSSELHDLPLLSQIPEGTDYDFTKPAQGSSQTAVVKKYGLGFSISEEAVADGKFDMIATGVQMLARSARESQEVQAMDIFNNGFSSELAADGVSVFNASHTLPSGGTFRNVLSVLSDLSDTSLEQMLVDFETQFVGDSGIIYSMQPKYLVVAPANKRLAMELIGSELRAQTAEGTSTGITNVNNMNSLKQDGLTVISSPHLTDSDAWFLTAEPADTGLRIVSREGITTKAAAGDAGFVNDSILYKCRYREDIVVTHAKGIFGSDGSA